jgi:hypothetical protein
MIFAQDVVAFLTIVMVKKTLKQEYQHSSTVFIVKSVR